MSQGHDESSSDVDRARAITRRLEKHKEEAQRPSRAAEYVRFDASRFAPATPAEAPRRAAPKLPEGPVDWETLLAWVRAFVGADAALLCDARGLLVALAGETTREHAEAMGARLVLAFEHADRMEAGSEASRFMVADFGDVVVSGLRVALPEGGRLVLGVAGRQALDASERAEIERALAIKVRQA